LGRYTLTAPDSLTLNEPKRENDETARCNFSIMVLPAPHEWFVNLTDPTKKRLMEAPDEPVPSDLIAEVCNAGALVVGAWWPSAQAGPDGMYLPAAMQDFLEATKRYVAYSRALEHRAAEADKYIVIAPFDGLSEIPMPKHTFDEAAAERWRDLDREVDRALRDYNDFVLTHQSTGYLGPLFE
jgi:hypothetical protein